jgi:hypothetical protein
MATESETGKMGNGIHVMIFGGVGVAHTIKNHYQ